MIERIRICLLHPRFIGKFLVEKTWKIIVLILILLILNFLGYIGQSSMNNTLSSTDKSVIVNSIVSGDTNLEYSNNTLSGESSTYVFYSDSAYITYGFLTTAEDEYNGLYFQYLETELNIYISNVLYKSVSYSDLNVSDFIIDSETSNNSRYYLSEFIKVPFEELVSIVIITNSMSDFGNLIFWGLITMIVAFAFAYNLNPTIRGKMRFVLLLHTMIPYLILNLFSILFSVSLLYYFGMFLSIIYYFIALRSIIKIETKSK